MTLWSFVVYLLMPYALGNLVWRGLRYPAYWYRWPERFGFVQPLPDARTIWVHAVSVGEVRSATPLILALADRYPQHRLVVTTMTPTGAAQVRDLCGDRVTHCYVPYDLPGAVRRFLDRVHPEVAVVAETEFWPNIFAECGRCIRVGADLPMALALALQQEHIVLIDVRADRSARRGEADHHVVDAPARQKIETLEQRAHIRVPLVDVLHEQRPVVIRQLGKFFFGERAVAQRPVILLAIVLHHARQRGFLAGKTGEVFRRKRRYEIRKRIADQQWLLLPVIAQELRGRHAEQLRGAGMDFE